MIYVKQVHKLIPNNTIKEILNHIAEHGQGEDSFDLLDEEGQLNVISTLCDNPTEWADKIKTFNN